MSQRGSAPGSWGLGYGTPDARFRLPRPWRVVEHDESFEFVAADGRSVQLYLSFADGERGRIMPRPTRALSSNDLAE